MNKRQQREADWRTLATEYAAASGTSSTTGEVVLLVISILVLAVGVAGIVFAYVSAPAIMPFAYMAAGLGAFTLSALVFVIWRRKREVGRQVAFGALARELNGDLIDGVGLADWLSLHWDAGYPVMAFWGTTEICRATVQIDGVPVLLDCTPAECRIGEASTPNEWWARVVVPGGPYPDGRVNPELPSVQAIGALGYQVSISQGGLTAKGTSTAKTALRKDLQSIFEVAPHLVRLKADLDAHQRNPQGVARILEWDQASRDEARRNARISKVPVTAIVFLLVFAAILIWLTLTSPI